MHVTGKMKALKGLIRLMQRHIKLGGTQFDFTAELLSRRTSRTDPVGDASARRLTLRGTVAR